MNILLVQACLRLPPVVADEAKLAIVGPGVLSCATRVGGRSEAGHCFHLLFSTPSAFPPIRGYSGSYFFLPHLDMWEKPVGWARVA